MAALAPDPLDGLDQRAKRDALREWRAEFLSLYQQDRAVGRDEGREVWRSRLEAVPKPSFRGWLEHVAETDPRARSLYGSMLEAEQKKARRTEILNAEAQRIERARASEPHGERDPERAATAAKDALRDRQRAADEAERAAQEALARVGFWGRMTGRGEAARTALAAEAAAAAARAAAGGTLRGVADDARAEAALNAAAHTGWLRRGGAAVLRDADTLQHVREAVADRDPKILKALDSERGYEAAAEIARQRMEAEERERREHEQRAAPRAAPATDDTHDAAHALPTPFKKSGD